jgi:hypothetical protein
MSLPPADIEPSKLWLKLQEMPRPSKVVDFPRTDADGNPVEKLAMWVLTQEEQMICSAAAEKFTREHLKDARVGEMGYDAIYTNAAAVEILFRACRNHEDLSRPAFPTPKALRSLPQNEVGVLFDNYLTVQLELGPIVANMSEEELNAWITRIGEGGSAFPFDSLSWEMQRILALTMALRLRASRTDTSSAGSPQGEEPTSAEPDAEPIGSIADDYEFEP